MNIPTPVAYCLLGIVLVLSITPIQKLTNKTVQWIKYRMSLKRQVLNTLNEVTRMVQDAHFRVISQAGVAKEIASPNAPIYDGVRYSGDTIAFIVSFEENIQQIVFIIRDKQFRNRDRQFRIWYDRGWFFKEKEGRVSLHGVSFWAASKLFRIAMSKRVPHKENCLKSRIRKIRLSAELRTCR